MIIDAIYNVITNGGSPIPRLTRSKLTRAEFNAAYGTEYDEWVDHGDEILIFKDTFVQIFVESHMAKDAHGLMLTTNDNHSVYMRLKLGSLDVTREICYVSCLLGSNMSRVNKSSLLWLYLKKLIVGSDPMAKTSDVVDTVLRSATAHSNNYYCWEFMRFYLNYAHTNGISVDITPIRDFCFKQVSDHSAWQFLSYYYRLVKVDLTYYSRYVAICDEWGLKPVPCPDDTIVFDIMAEIAIVLDYIDRSHITSWVPYEFLIPFIDHIPIDTIQDAIDKFEKENGEIQVKSSWYETAVLRNDKDLAFDEELNINGHKKRLLQWGLMIK